MMWDLLLESAYVHSIAVARAETRKFNVLARRGDPAFSLSDEKFTKRYRLTKDLTLELIAELTPHLPPTLRSDALSVDTKVLVALGFMASGSYQTMVGDCRTHYVSQGSVSNALQQVVTALNKPGILNKYVSFPFHQNEREHVISEFYRHYKMPGLLGCVDGTHVAIVCPHIHEERYINRKGYHSLNVLIMCDSNLNILCVDSSFPGSTHDSVVWGQHPLNAYLERLHRISGEDVYVLGDSGYALRTTTMIPYTDAAHGSPEQNYQELHLTARNVVERCIGVLKARFRCLLVDRKLHYAPEVAAKITNACCVLHNIVHRANIPFTQLTRVEAARERELTQEASFAALAQPRRRGRGAAGVLSELELGRARRHSLIQRLWLANRSN